MKIVNNLLFYLAIITTLLLFNGVLQIGDSDLSVELGFGILGIVFLVQALANSRRARTPKK